MTSVTSDGHMCLRTAFWVVRSIIIERNVVSARNLQRIQSTVLYRTGKKFYRSVIYPIAGEIVDQQSGIMSIESKKP